MQLWCLWRCFHVTEVRETLSSFFYVGTHFKAMVLARTISSLFSYHKHSQLPSVGWGLIWDGVFTRSYRREKNNTMWWIFNNTTYIPFKILFFFPLKAYPFYFLGVKISFLSCGVMMLDNRFWFSCPYLAKLKIVKPLKSCTDPENVKCGCHC